MSLENLIISPRQDRGEDPGLPQPDENTLFRMHSFNSLADVRDKGPSAIPVTRGTAISVGRDETGSFMKFSGNGSFVNFPSPLLNLPEVDIIMIVDSLAIENGSWAAGPALVDSRPSSVNGDYFTAGFDRFLPFRLATSFKAANSPLTTAIDNTKSRYDFSFRKTKSVVKINNVERLSWSITGNGLTGHQNWTIGRNAFKGVGVPDLIGKVYYFELRKPT